MKLKLDDAGHVVVSEGKPVYVTDDGKEVAFDVAGTVATISRLNSEAKGHRERAEKAEGALKTFDGIDPAAARDAVDKLSKIDAKKLVEAGDMDAAIKAAVKPYEDKLAAADKTTGDLSTRLQKAMIGNGFSQSKFAAEKLTPAGVDLIRTMFGDRIKVEGDAVVGYDAGGQKLYSKARPGELASFDEVVETLVDSYPFKEHILKGSGSTGTGGKPSSGTGAGKTRTTAEFNAMTPKDRSAFMAEGGKLTD